MFKNIIAQVILNLVFIQTQNKSIFNVENWFRLGYKWLGQVALKLNSLLSRKGDMVIIYNIG